MKAWRVPIVAGSVARLAYGLSAVLAPDWMSGRLAPRILGHPDPRMNLRGFGGAQSAIAIYTLMAATTPDGARRVLRLNALVDALDTVVSLLPPGPSSAGRGTPLERWYPAVPGG
jgi:hypothetical protein